MINLSTISLLVPLMAVSSGVGPREMKGGKLLNDPDSTTEKSNLNNEKAYYRKGFF
jgi:hypothetical protein